MSITVYADVIMPYSVLAAGVRGRNMRRNVRTQAQNGTMQINVAWSRTLRQFELGTVPMKVEAWQAIEGLHEVTEGGAFGFLMEDPKDSSATFATGKALAIPSSTTTFQLVKRYTSAGSTRTKDRPITRPRGGSNFALKINGVLSGSYSLNTTTGIVTIGSAPSAGTITWEGGFYVPVHFSSDEIDWELTVAGNLDQRYLTGPSVVLVEVRE